MIESFVKDVDLTLAIAASIERNEARRAATDTIIPAVLGALEDRLACLLGTDAIVAIRSLQFDCSFALEAPNLAAEAMRLGEDLASAIAASATEFDQRGTASDSDWVIFPTIGDFLGCALVSSLQPSRVASWPFVEFADAPAVARRLEECSTADVRAASRRVAALVGDDEPSDPLKFLRAVADGTARGKPTPPFAVQEDRVAAPAEPAALGGEREAALASPEDSDSERTLGPEAPPAAGPRQQPAAEDAHVELEEHRSAPRIAERKAANPEGPSASLPPSEVVADTEPPSGNVATTTHVAGLVYVLRPILDLGIAEQLWTAGLLESERLADVALALVGPNHARDPAIRTFFGALSPAASPPHDWARAEIEAKTLASIAASFGPSVAQEIAPRLGGGSIAEGLAAAIAAVVNLRLKREPNTALDELLSLQGTLSSSDEEIVLTLEAQAIDIGIRRAGLDKNPGFVPWLNKRVTIAFRGLEVL